MALLLSESVPLPSLFDFMTMFQWFSSSGFSSSGLHNADRWCLSNSKILSEKPHLNAAGWLCFPLALKSHRFSIQGLWDLIGDTAFGPWIVSRPHHSTDHLIIGNHILMLQPSGLFLPSVPVLEWLSHSSEPSKLPGGDVRSSRRDLKSKKQSEKIQINFF